VASILVVGLGNPGSEYAGTRHNAGFMVVEELARRARVRFRPGKGDFWYAPTSSSEGDVILVEPATYMNQSGTAVVEALDQFALTVSDMIVVVDDFALPLGSLRIRPGGTDGGHNGLASTIYQLSTEEFARLRCGIRKEVMPPKELTAEFVLTQFDVAERPTVETMVGRAADAIQELQRSGIERAMALFNSAPASAEQ
jgi:peptidyl-tRNA hydrolase, PTH1 family